MAYQLPKEPPETFNSFKIEVGPHETTLKTSKNMDGFEVRGRIIQALDAMLGITVRQAD